MLAYIITVSIIAASSGLDFPSNAHYNLPEVTLLDDYHKCLSKKNALYCFGTFRINSNGSDKEKYEFIAEYSKPPQNYDRKYFHRGYCVSARCPSHPNAKERFERCVQASQKGLNTTLETLYFCQTQKKTVEADPLTLIYLIVVLIIALLNIIGTFLDVRSGGVTSKFWTSWSIRSNWREFVGPFGNDPETVALAPIQGVRIVLMLVVIFLHVFILIGASYLYNPEFIEQFIMSPVRVWPIKIASVVQVSFALSSFFSAYHLLVISKRQQLTLRMMPNQIIKRFIRIAPVHLLVVGFGATLWPLMSEGPAWSAKIHPSSEMCRVKFWTHLLHINNLVRPLDHCLPQTWSLAADVQLQIVAVIITILLSQYKLPKVNKVLMTLLTLSTLFNAVLAYIYDWTPFIFIISAKNVASLGNDLVTYTPYYYMSPWGSLPSCIVGLIFAHTYFNWRLYNSKLEDHKTLAHVFRYSLPLLVLWIMAGNFSYLIESPLILSIYTAIERPLFAGLVISWLFGMIVGGESSVKRMLCWRGWLPIGRLSLSVLMVHWTIILSNYCYRPKPLFGSYAVVMMDFVATSVISYILAIPFTLMVELPVMNTYNYFKSKSKKDQCIEPKRLLNKQE